MKAQHLQSQAMSEKAPRAEGEGGAEGEGATGLVGGAPEDLAFAAGPFAFAITIAW